jgi:hypothetical protein
MKTGGLDVTAARYGHLHAVRQEVLTEAVDIPPRSTDRGRCRAIRTDIPRHEVAFERTGREAPGRWVASTCLLRRQDTVLPGRPGFDEGSPVSWLLGTPGRVRFESDAWSPTHAPDTRARTSVLLLAAPARARQEATSTAMVIRLIVTPADGRRRGTHHNHHRMRRSRPVRANPTTAATSPAPRGGLN